MKKILSIAFLMTGIALSTQAQEKQAEKQENSNSNKERKEWRKDGHDDLQLSADQKAKMKVKHEEFSAKAKAIKSNTSLTEDEKKQQFKALHEKRRESMKEILTPEQQLKMKQHRKDMTHKKSHRKQSNQETTK